LAELTTLEAAVPALRRYALALLRNRDDADDLVQDCLLRALDRIETRMGDGDIRPWLFTIMHNLFVNRWRRHARRSAWLVEGDAAEASVPAPQTAELEMKDVLRGLATLPEDQRQVIILVTVEGFSYAEVAKIVGVPIGTVMSRLSRGRDRLNAFMDGQQQRPLLRRVK
jgi:RNA polymerase sigma-70 factor (ECF subfamily)